MFFRIASFSDLRHHEQLTLRIFYYDLEFSIANNVVFLLYGIWLHINIAVNPTAARKCADKSENIVLVECWWNHRLVEFFIKNRVVSEALKDNTE